MNNQCPGCDVPRLMFSSSAAVSTTTAPCTGKTRNYSFSACIICTRMGCMHSKEVTPFPNEAHPNLFTVRSLSRKGKYSPGTLEVCAAEITFHQGGRDPIRWPLHYLRRYAVEDDRFMFECGRRCESGPGVFTFVTRRAQDIFLMIQHHVQVASGEERARLNVLMHGTRREQYLGSSSLSSGDSVQNLTANGHLPLGNEAATRDIPPPIIREDSEPNGTIFEAREFPNSPHLPDLSTDQEHSVYVRLSSVPAAPQCPLDTEPPSDVFDDDDIQPNHSYVNVVPTGRKPIASDSFVSSHSHSSSSANSTPRKCRSTPAGPISGMQAFRRQSLEKRDMTPDSPDLQRAYINVLSPSVALEYVTVNVGSGSGTPTPRHVRHSSFGSLRNDPTQLITTNYAVIDTQKTRALQDTASLLRPDWAAGMSRRSRHSSIVSQCSQSQYI